MNGATEEVPKLGDCIGQWSSDAEECDRCLFVRTCRTKTQENAEPLEIERTPIEQFVSIMGKDCYMVEQTRPAPNLTLTKFGRNGVAIYVSVNDDGFVQGKVWGKVIDLGPLDINRFDEYVKTLVMKADAGENTD